MSGGEEIVVLGRLLDPYGVRGWLHLHPFGDDPLDWAEMPVWWVGQEGGPWQQRKLIRLRVHGDGLVVLLDGLVDRSGAEAMKGLLVGAPRDVLPVPEENAFYWADLIGLSVVNLADEPLGRVVGLIETGANDVLRVQDAGGTEHLLPFVDAVVRSVDLAGGTVRVDWGQDWS